MGADWGDVATGQGMPGPQAGSGEEGTSPRTFGGKTVSLTP